MNLNEFEKAQIAYNNSQLFEYDCRKIIQKFTEIINENKNEILRVSEIEKKYNPFVNINKYLKMKNGNKITKKGIEQRKTEDDFIISKYKESLGVIGVIFDGDIYVLIELLKKMIYTKNAMIFCTNNKMYAITGMIVLYFRQALKICGYDEEIVQIINSEDYLEMYNHNNILAKIIVIGSKDLQNKVIATSNIEVITSGYGFFDIYIEDLIDLEFIKKMIKQKDIGFNIYINKNISLEKIEEMNITEYTEIDNIEECIRDMNINSAGYSSSIFTKNPVNANEFLKLVKSKYVFVNASPTLERTLDISENNLLYVKQVMYKNH